MINIFGEKVKMKKEERCMFQILNGDCCGKLINEMSTLNRKAKVILSTRKVNSLMINLLNLRENHLLD